MTYGIISQGFARKPMEVILAEIEEANRLSIGRGVIQTAQSPLGQINGIFAEAAAKLWEVAEDVYQSYDPDQAGGVRLDILARIRLLERAAGESDTAFRQDITNAGRARFDISDVVRAVQNVTGVTFVRVHVNDTGSTDANGIQSHSVCIAVVGGTDAEIGEAIAPYVVPGIGTYGNTPVSVEIDGFCRQLYIMRPAARDIVLTMTVSAVSDAFGCPAPSSLTMATALVEELTGSKQPANGADVTMHQLRTALSCRFPNVEILTALGAIDPATPAALPVAVAFDEYPVFTVENITVST
jgi:hypothetical protein